MCGRVKQYTVSCQGMSAPVMLRKDYLLFFVRHQESQQHVAQWLAFCLTALGLWA